MDVVCADGEGGGLIGCGRPVEIRGRSGRTDYLREELGVVLCEGGTRCEECEEGEGVEDGGLHSEF